MELSKDKQKNKAVSAVHGNIYQLKLLMLFLYRGVSQRYSFRLSTEIEEANKFDDLIFEYVQDDEKLYRLLQAKHKLVESKKITAHNLLKEKGGDYNLIKYFLSYQSSKKSHLFKDGSIKDVIICTNIDFDFENLKRAQIKVENIEDKDDILDVESGKRKPKRYRFSEEVAKLQEMASFPAHEVKDFLNHLVFAVNQPNEEELGTIIKEELGKEFDLDLITTENLYNKFFITMLNWFQGKERGIFLSYEEGKEFFEEARRGIPIWFGVRDPIESFIGRAEELENLHRILEDEDATVISQAVSVSGLGGIGKSELARKYINEHSQDYENKVIWINAESYQTLAESFRRLACDKLRISTKNANGEEKEITSIIEDVYKFFSDGKSLFVFDNAEKYRSQDEFDQGIDRFLFSQRPNNKNRPHILITSRNRKWPKNIKVLLLDAFTEDEAIEFIKNSLNIENDAQEKEIKELSKELQNFPLALQQAVSYIRVQDEKLKNVGSRFKINNYLEIFREKTEKLLNFEFPEDSDNEYTKTTYVTWNVTFDALKQKENGRDALEILNIISYLAPENIPVELLLSLVSDEEKLGSAIELLKQYSMVNSEHRKLSVHRLVQLVTRIKLGKQNGEKEILKTVLKLFDKDNVNAQTIDHAISAWNYSSKYSELVKDFPYTSGYICRELIHSGRYDEAYLFGLKVLDILGTMPLDNHIIQIILMTENNIGHTLLKQGKYDMALKTLLKVLFIETTILEPDISDILKTESNIALTISKQGKYHEALANLQEILKNSKIILGENHPDTLLIKHNIATIFLELKKIDEALQMLQEIHDIQKNILGENHLQTLNTKHSIASALSGQGKYNQALRMYEKIQSSEAAILNKNLPDNLIRKTNLGTVLIKQGTYSDALQAYQEALSAEKVLGENHPDVLRTHYLMGEVLRSQSRYREALEVFKEIFEKQENILGSDHPDVLITKHSIAVTLCDLGNYNDALQICQEVLDKRRVMFGYDHIDTLKVRDSIALIFSEQGEYDKAVQQYQAIYEIQAKCLGENHPDTMSMKNNMAMTLHKTGKYDKALQILEEVFTYKQNLYPDHPSTLLSKGNIAMVYLSQKKNCEALKMYREVLASQETILGKEHHHTMVTKKNIATILFEEGKLDEALKFFYEVFDGFNKVLGPENEDTLETNKIIDSLIQSVNILLAAAKNNDLKIIERYSKNGGDVNVKDNKGKTMLHYAIENGNIDIVNILLKYGADVRRVCHKGKTALHIATSKGFKEVVKKLLLCVSRRKLNEYINAKIISDGTTSLHVATKNGFLEIVLVLLKHGATYDVQNKDGKTPFDLSQKRNVTNLLKLTAELFEDAKNGNNDITNKLKTLKPDKFEAVTNARNNQGHTLLQVALVNKHNNIVKNLLKILKNAE